MKKELTQQELPQKMVDKEQIREELKRQLQKFYEYCKQVEKAAKEEAELSQKEGNRLH